MIATHKTNCAQRLGSHEAPRRPHLRLAPEAGLRGPETAIGSSSVSRLADDGGQEITVLSISGDVDLATAPVMRELLASVLERGTAPIVVDISDVPFMDSTGVHLLVDAHRRLKSENRRFAIACREHGQVCTLLALAGLLDLLAVHRSRDSAVTDGDDLIRSEPGGAGVRGARGTRRFC